MTRTFKLGLLAAAAAFAAGAFAQPNIEKLKQFKVATTDLNIPTVPQSGPNAAAWLTRRQKFASAFLAPSRPPCDRP